MIDEELLKPSRELLARLGAQIETLRAETHQKIERYGHNDRAYAREQWRELWQKIEPIQRERDAALKVITDYYNLHTNPPPFVIQQEKP